MSYGGCTPTKFGRYAIALPFRPGRLHLHDGSPLKEVDHEPPVPTLDQEDLHAQGISLPDLVPGAADADALGSCTCNAGTVSLAERFAAKHGTVDLPGIGLSTTDPVAGEKYAITLYHAVTDQTGDPAQEWPPTDCGSSGYYVCTELEKQKLITGYRTASGIHNLVSLLQAGTVMMGAPWFRAWMEPDGQGFVDGTGSMTDLQAAVSSGVAGGHETCISAVERLTFNALGLIDPGKSHVRVRNSWSTAFGDHGSYRVHLSTLQMLGHYADFKQMVL